MHKRALIVQEVGTRCMLVYTWGMQVIVEIFDSIYLISINFASSVCAFSCGITKFSDNYDENIEDEWRAYVSVNH